MTGPPDQSDFVTGEWTRHGTQPLFIAIMVTAQCAALALAVEPFLPGQSWLPATVLALVVALQGVYGTNWLELQGYFILSRPVYRLGELALIVVAIRVITWIAAGAWPDLAQVRIYILDPMAFFDAAFVLTLGLAIFAWQRAAAVAALFCWLAIGREEAELYRTAPKGTKQPSTRDRSPLLAEFYRSWLWGGVLLLICAAVTSFELPSFERSDGPLNPVMTGALLVYVLVGFWLLSRGRLAVLNEHWMVFGMRAQARVERRWRRASLRVLAAAVAIAAFLPFGSASPMSGVFNTAISVLFTVMLAMHSFVVLVIAGILRLFGVDKMGGTVETAPPSSPPPISEKSGEITAMTPIDSMLAGSLFWLTVGGLAVIAIIFFLRDRGYVFDWATLARLGRGLRRWFAALLRGVAAEVDDMRIAIQTALRIDPGVAPGGKTPWRFIRVNGLPARDQVRYFYLSALRHAARRGVGRRDHQTPLEYANDLTGRWPEARHDTDALTAMFVKARYTRETIDDTEAGVARALWKRLRATLKRRPVDSDLA